MPKKGLNIVLSMSFFLKKKNTVLQWRDKKCTHCFCCGWSKTQSTQFVIWLLPLPLPKCSSIPPDAVQQHRSGGSEWEEVCQSFSFNKKTLTGPIVSHLFYNCLDIPKNPQIPNGKEFGCTFCPSPSALSNTRCTKPAGREGLWYRLKNRSQALRSEPHPCLEALRRGKTQPWG